MEKKNPFRFNVCLDPEDPLQRKVAELLNAQPRIKRQAFIAEAIVVASQTPRTLQDWLKMQSDFLGDNSAEVMPVSVASLSTSIKTDPEPISIRQKPDEITSPKPPIPEPRPAKEEDDWGSGQNKDVPMSLSYDDDEDAEDEDLEEFISNMKAFGADY